MALRELKRKELNTPKPTTIANNIDSLMRNVKATSVSNKPTVKDAPTTTSVSNRKDIPLSSSTKSVVSQYKDAVSRSDTFKNTVKEKGIQRPDTGILNNNKNKTRNDFDNDNAYERYLFDNNVNLSSKESNDYINQKAQQENKSYAQARHEVILRNKNRQNTEKLQDKFTKGELTQEDNEAINQYFKVYDKQGKEVDRDWYTQNVNKANQEAERINNEVDVLNNRLRNNEIDNQTYQLQFNELQNQWANNQEYAKQFSDYDVKSGFDYYNYAKERGEDVSDFENYAEKVDDLMLERLGEQTLASWADTANILPQVYDMAKTVLTGEDYLNKDTSLSKQLRDTSRELKEYSLLGANPFQEWSTQTIGALMPMVNSMLVGDALGALGGVQNLGNFVGTFTNATLGLQNAGETTARRLQEGNDIASATINGIMHGAISGIVEGFDMGNIKLFTGSADDLLLPFASGLFQKASAKQVGRVLLKNFAGEAKEELFEAIFDYVGDMAQNTAMSIMDSLNGTTTQRINEDKIDPRELGKEMVMAGIGAVLMGGPSAVINSKAKYNGAIEARNYFNSVLNSSLATEQQKEVARIAINKINNELITYENRPGNELTEGVDLPSDKVDSVGTFDEALNNLVNSMQLDVQQDIRYATETYERATALQNDFQNALAERGININANDYMNMNARQQRGTKIISNFFNSAGMDYEFNTNLGRGFNGTVVNGRVVINPVQTDTFNIEAIADMDTNALAKALAQDSETLYEPSSNNADIQTTGIHETVHTTENAKQEWNKLNNLIKESMGDQRYNQALNNIKKIYETRIREAGIKKGLSEAEIQKQINGINPESELVAFYIQKHLSNEEFLTKLANYNSNVFNRLYDNLQALFTNDSNIKLENAVEQAFYKARQQSVLTNQNTRGNTYGVGGTNYERTNAFRNIQESSNRLSSEELQLYHTGNRRIDINTRQLLENAFREQIVSTNNRGGHFVRTNLISPITNQEVEYYSNVDANTFHDIFEIAQKYLPNGDAVDVHKTADYINNKNYLVNNGMGGFSITPNGDLISVYSLPGTKLLINMKDVINKEAKTLDCFASNKQNLPEIYQRFLGENWKVASYCEFNYDILAEEYGKEYADYFVKTYGEAPVAFMVNTTEDIGEPQWFNKDQYEEALNYRNQFVNNEDTQYSMGRFNPNDIISRLTTAQDTRGQIDYDNSIENNAPNVDDKGRKLTKKLLAYHKANKLTDLDGKLITLYHGTPNKDFHIFEKSKRGSENGGLDTDLGTFTSNNKGIAEIFTNFGQGEIKEMYGYAEKPLFWNLLKYAQGGNINVNELIELEQDLNYIFDGKNVEITAEDVKNGNLKHVEELIKMFQDDEHKRQYGGYGKNTFTDVEVLKERLADEGAYNRLIERGYDAIALPLAQIDRNYLLQENKSTDGYEFIFPESNNLKYVSNKDPHLDKDDLRLSIGRKGKADTQINDVSTQLENILDTAGMDYAEKAEILNRVNEAWNRNQANIERYGAYDLGNNPVRNAEIARENEYGPVSRSLSNLANSPYVSDETAMEIQRRASTRLANYEQETNKQQQQVARQMISEMGMNDAYKYAMTTDSLQTASVDTVFLKELLNEFRHQRLTNTLEYQNLITRLSWRSAMSGQALQAYNTFRSQTPEGQIMTIESEVERIQQQLNERYGAGKYNVQVNQDLIQQYLEAETWEEREDLREQIAQDVARQIPPTLMEQLNSFRHVSMLFNPRTWVKNRVANELFGYINEGTRGLRTMLESIFYNIGQNNPNSRFANMERQAGVYNPLSTADRNLYTHFINDYNNKYKGKIDMKYTALDAGNILLGTEFGDRVAENRDQFTNQYLNKIADFGGKMLSDYPGMSKAYAKSMVGYFKANNLDIDTVSEEQLQKARDFAIAEAKYATFNSTNWLANKIVEFERNLPNTAGGKATLMAIESFIPFKRTPLNLIRTGFHYSPAGLMKAIYDGSVSLKNGKITANQFINELAQGMSGTSLFVLGMLLRSMGLFRTKDDDKDRKQKYDESLGEQDYSISLGNAGTFTIDWADPMIVPLAMGAEAYNNYADGQLTLEEAVNVLTSLAEPMFETSMLSGISRNLSSFQQGTTEWWTQIAKNTISNYITQYVPSIGGALARTIDDTRRNPYSGQYGGLEQTLRQIGNKIPGMSMLGEPYVDYEGNNQKAEDLGIGIAGRAIQNFLLPGYYASNDMDDYDRELYRLYDETGEISALPSTTTRNISYDNEKYKLLNEDYTEYQRTRRTIENEEVRNFIDSDIYESLNDSQRVNVIENIRKYAGMEATAEYLDTQGVDYDNSEYNKVRQALDSGVSVQDYFISKQYYNGLSGDTKKSDYIDYINAQDISPEAKNYLYDQQYGSSKFVQYVNNMSLDAGAKLTIKELSAQYTKSEEFAYALKQAGLLDYVVEYAKANNLDYNAVGLSKKAVANYYYRNNPAPSGMNMGDTGRTSYRVSNSQTSPIENMLRAIQQNTSSRQNNSSIFEDVLKSFRNG